MTREPVLTAASIVAAATAVLAVLAAFGLPLTAEQQAAVLGLIGVAAPYVVALLARRKVTPLADPRDASGKALLPAAE